MKICSRCNVERNDDEYYTYWHSTQQKYRTRNVCTPCTTKQVRDYKRKVKEEPAVVKEIEPTQLCPCCKKDVPLTGYYDSGKGVKGRYCISCIRKNQNERNYNKVMSEGGSERVCQKPNTYADEYQKAQTFMVLERLGWKYNDNGVWSKEGVKTADNVWLNIVPQKRTKRRPDGVIVRKKHGVYNYIKEIVEQKEEGMTYPELAYIYCCSHTTIRKIVNDFYREKKDG